MAGENSEKRTEDLRSQFRQALERKRGQQQDGAGGVGGANGKVHERHGKAASKRQFRRKSG
jgi:hypothetical protein